ncbi:MAG: DUF1934 domain-containing protein [Clostridia bacterium]|nr:DUF1934 domain-containing protein [Clostridia bacterium]
MIDEKEVRLTVASVIDNLTPSGLSDGDPERTEVSVCGKMLASPDAITLKYREQEEGSEVNTEIVIYPAAVKVMRSGSIESEMYFEEGIVHTSLYRVPPYSFDAEIKTRKIRSSMTVNGGQLDIYYSMKIGGADKSVKMSVRAV